MQGKLGDCWLLAAMANLTLKENLFNSVVCEDNSDYDENYCGIFHFRFWHFGKFVDVVVDDLLPTSDGKNLIYTKSSDKNEFWSALLEKAYAKLYGGYEKIEGGFTSEAFEDFTGGVVEVYELKNAPGKIFEFILKSFNRNVFFACSIMDYKNIRGTGLYDFHAYSITGVNRVKLSPIKIVDLLRIRNPWGQCEWSGAWSDHSVKWKEVSETYKKAIGLEVDDDGEFWMSFEDFKKYFDTLEICNLHPDIEMKVQNPTRKWNMISFEGHFSAKWSHEIEVTDPDEYDDEDFCTVVIALMQKHTRYRNNQNHPISFDIQSLNGSSFKTTPPCKQNFDLREICHRYELKPGTYSITPFKFNGSSDGEYLLRVFYETKHGDHVYANHKSYTRESDFTDISEQVVLQANVKKQTRSQVPTRVQKQYQKNEEENCCCNIM